jgi:hypothetical protein
MKTFANHFVVFMVMYPIATIICALYGINPEANLGPQDRFLFGAGMAGVMLYVPLLLIMLLYFGIQEWKSDKEEKDEKTDK